MLSKSTSSDKFDEIHQVVIDRISDQWKNLQFAVYHMCVWSGISSDKQERYKLVTKCTYWPVLGAFNNWNIIQLLSKSTSSDTFDEIHQVVIDRISDTMASLVESGKRGDIITTNTYTNGFYVIIFTSGAYTLQENTTIDGKIITAG